MSRYMLYLKAAGWIWGRAGPPFTCRDFFHRTLEHTMIFSATHNIYLYAMSGRRRHCTVNPRSGMRISEAMYTHEVVEYWKHDNIESEDELSDIEENLGES